MTLITIDMAACMFKPSNIQQMKELLRFFFFWTSGIQFMCSFENTLGYVWHTKLWATFCWMSCTYFCRIHQAQLFFGRWWRTYNALAFVVWWWFCTLVQPYSGGVRKVWWSLHAAWLWHWHKSPPMKCWELEAALKENAAAGPQYSLLVVYVQHWQQYQSLKLVHRRWENW